MPTDREAYEAMRTGLLEQRARGDGEDRDLTQLIAWLEEALVWAGDEPFDQAIWEEWLELAAGFVR